MEQRGQSTVPLIDHIQGGPLSIHRKCRETMTTTPSSAPQLHRHETQGPWLDGSPHLYFRYSCEKGLGINQVHPAEIHAGQSQVIVFPVFIPVPGIRNH